MKRMIQHYTRIAFIDMGYEDQDGYRDYARKVADELGLRYEEIKGTTALLERMCKGPWDEDEFIVAPPGQAIRLEDFGMDMAGKHQDSASVGDNNVRLSL